MTTSSSYQTNKLVLLNGKTHELKSDAVNITYLELPKHKFPTCMSNSQIIQVMQQNGRYQLQTWNELKTDELQFAQDTLAERQALNKLKEKANKVTAPKS